MKLIKELRDSRNHKMLGKENAILRKTTEVLLFFRQSISTFMKYFNCFTK